MKLVIIPSDGAVYVDGVSHSDLDLNFIPSDVHALQWNQTKGWVEFKDNDDVIKPQNQVITELPQWALDCVQIYQDFIVEIARLEAERQAERQAAISIPVTVVE